MGNNSAHGSSFNLQKYLIANKNVLSEYQIANFITSVVDGLADTSVMQRMSSDAFVINVNVK